MSCEQAIEARLDESRRSTLPSPQRKSSPSASNLVSTTTQDHVGARSIDPVDVRQGERRRRTASESEENNEHKRRRRPFHDVSGEQTNAGVNQNEDEDKLATKNITKKIRKGLKDLAVEDEISFPPTPKTNETQKELGLPDETSDQLCAQICISVEWERALWRQSASIKVESNRSIWYLRLLASYFFLLRTSVIEKHISWTDSVPIPTISTKNRVLWRTAASMISAIILELSSEWGSKAYLVIQALAGK